MNDESYRPFDKIVRVDECLPWIKRLCRVGYDHQRSLTACPSPTQATILAPLINLEALITVGTSFHRFVKRMVKGTLAAISFKLNENIAERKL